jgi:polar amino acid transport system substrate-binding protein
MAGLKTIEAGTMRIGSAFPNPPFELEREGVDTGFDAELMRAVCGQVGLRWNLVKYDGADFNGIFDGLRTGDYDTVISGTTITPDREKVALFSEPYLESGPGLVVNTARTPHITSVDDLSDQVIGLRTGDSSDLVARQLLADGRLADLRYYPYGHALEIINDLDEGRIGGFMTLLPVATWLVKEHPDLAVKADLPTGERLGIAFAPGGVGLRDAVNQALAECRRTGLLERLERRWLP